MVRHWGILFVCWASLAAAQIDGLAAYEAFIEWRQSHVPSKLSWEETVERYRTKLRPDGLSEPVAEKMLRIISARDEAVLYNPAYFRAPTFNTRPNRLLVEAVEGRSPGKALDVGMGQGRNAIYLAQRGWEVTGFDVAEAGLEKANQRAAALGVVINTEHLSDKEFDFGKDRWNLIAIIYAIEKRSVYRVRQALHADVRQFELADALRSTVEPRQSAARSAILTVVN